MLLNVDSCIFGNIRFFQPIYYRQQDSHNYPAISSHYRCLIKNLSVQRRLTVVDRRKITHKSTTTIGVYNCRAIEFIASTDTLKILEL